MKITKFQLSNPKQSGFTPHLLVRSKVRNKIAHGKGAGFTLIEMIIYLAIVSIVLVSMSYLILDLIGGQSKSFANQETNQNLRFIVNTISQDVVSAQDFSLVAADTLVLAVPGDDI